jgi:hypothetical protein
MAWEVDDLEETIAELRQRGVIFEEYDGPGLKTVTGLPRSKGTTPAKGAPGRRPPGSKTARATYLPSVKP